MADIAKMIEEIKSMTVLELNDLVKAKLPQRAAQRLPQLKKRPNLTLS